MVNFSVLSFAIVLHLDFGISCGGFDCRRSGICKGTQRLVYANQTTSLGELSEPTELTMGEVIVCLRRGEVCSIGFGGEMSQSKGPTPTRENPTSL